MKIILVFVTTLDGKITRWGDPVVKSWTSSEDQEYFSGLIRENKIIVMGSSTFNADPVKHFANNHLVVMTRKPGKYKKMTIPGRLEFSDESPLQIVQRFEKEGKTQILVVGGPHVATSWFKDNLIDELWLTFEPRIFGTGGNLVTEEKLDIRLRLISCEKVNEPGTLITKYAVIK